MSYYRDSVPENPDEFRRYIDNELRKLEDYSELIDERLTVENWREVGAVGEPAFENSWVNYDAGWDTAGFYKDPFGRVHIKGRVKDGTLNTAIFILPEGYRPPVNLLFATIADTTPIRIQVHASGVVVTASSTINASTGLNISFRV